MIGPNGMTITEREYSILNQASTMDDISRHILGGGTLLDLALTWNIPWGTIRLWMAGDPERDKAYIRAMNMWSEMEKDKIQRELNRIAFADLKKIYNADGTLKPFIDWPDDVAAAVSGLQYEDGKLVEFKRADKLKALELAGKAIAMFNEKVTVDGAMTLEQMLVVVDKQARASMQPTVVEAPKAIEEGKP